MATEPVSEPVGVLLPIECYALGVEVCPDCGGGLVDAQETVLGYQGGHQSYDVMPVTRCGNPQCTWKVQKIAVAQTQSGKLLARLSRERLLVNKNPALSPPRCPAGHVNTLAVIQPE